MTCWKSYIKMYWACVVLAPQGAKNGWNGKMVEGWKGLFPTSSPLRHEKRVSALGIAACQAWFFWETKFCVKGRVGGWLGKQQRMENKGDLWGIIIFQWGTGSTQLYTSLHNISWVHHKLGGKYTFRNKIFYVLITHFTCYSIISLILLRSRSHICEIID